jgi:intracellular sulfur oxidation DsrE/DsrF family protein
MTFKHWIFTLLLTLSLSTHAAEQIKYRVVIQVSENSIDRMNMALNTASNLQHQFGPDNIDVEIVVFGDAVNTLKYYAPIPIGDKVEELTTEGVRIVASEIAMRIHKLRPSDMLQQVRYVSSGAAEIVEKQHAGWAYLRP